MMVDRVIGSLQDKISIGVYFVNNAPEDQILQFKATLEQRPDIKSVDYVSRQAALDRFRQLHKNDVKINEALNKLNGQNPLPPSLTIKAQRSEDYPTLVKMLEKSQYQTLIEEIDYIKRQDAITNLQQVASHMNQAALIASIIMALISFLVSFNTLRLVIYNDRQKISIMRLVGASNNFVRGPFIVQGIIYGVTSAFITLFVFAIFLQAVNGPIESYFRGLEPVSLANYYSVHWLRFFAIQLFIGIAVGVASSIIAIRRYLKV